LLVTAEVHLESNCSAIILTILIIGEKNTLMVIHITHKGALIKGKVIYSLLAVKNLVLVHLEKQVPGLEKDIMLMYENSTWQTTDEMQRLFPEIFSQIVTKLDAVLRRCSI